MLLNTQYQSTVRFSSADRAVCGSLQGFGNQQNMKLTGEYYDSFATIMKGIVYLRPIRRLFCQSDACTP